MLKLIGSAEHYKVGPVVGNYTSGYYALSQCLGLTRGGFPDVGAGIALFTDLPSHPKLQSRLSDEDRNWISFLSEVWENTPDARVLFSDNALSITACKQLNLNILNLSDSCLMQ